MRWYKNENSDFFYCDELLDLVGEFLREFSEIYQREFQCKPNIHELESILSLAFRTGTDDHLSKNSDGKFIDNVRFKISKRNKKQTCAVGDVFSIPLPSGGYGFGRIIYLDNVKWNVSAVFSYYSNNKIYSPGIIHSKELMPPVLMMPSVFFIIGDIQLFIMITILSIHNLMIYVTYQALLVIIGLIKLENLAKAQRFPMKMRLKSQDIPSAILMTLRY
ncbi:hypothetical protein K5994_003908 [Salmonella enterica]|nr:hypothetical protein [Salmonella enterica subsp. enterica]EHZ5033875.1 hypothetical protein [Salmonella enterica]